jgi:hypothetical protein
MGRFVAEVVFAFEMEDITAGGRRLHDLADVASRLGFAMRSCDVREAPPDARPPIEGTRYAPE